MVNTFLIGSSTITGTLQVDSRKINDFLLSRQYLTGDHCFVL